MSSAATVTVRRLAWAGVEVAAGDVRVVIDPLQNTADLAGFQGMPRRPMPGIGASPGCGPTPSSPTSTPTTAIANC